MHELDAISRAARTSTRAEFVQDYRGYFLVKRPRKTSVTPSEKPTFSYSTVAAKTDVDPFADKWQIFPVAKRPGNPFPERITIGRAPNCDISLRVPFISKAHAHIVAEANGSFAVRDNQGANGTFHNGRRLEAGDQPRVSVGDTLRFSSLEFEFVNGSRLYDIMLNEARG